MSTARPSVKFVTAVWGEAYIRRFVEIALPSFVAPGNIPALACAVDLESVILTRSLDVPRFRDHAAFARLEEACPVRFMAIDDLVTNGCYGVTLTLAYARPVIACGVDMLNTFFVFMNADFVLADGSLGSLCKHIEAGRSIVLGPSFRATAEDVEPKLKASVDGESGVLSIAPRELTAMSLPHAHPTTQAKVVNQNFCHSLQPNQFFWRVDEHTLLGRYYLVFMLCLKPERILDAVNSYCDYAFIPELCPSGDEVAMGDSDEFFMLELQWRQQESELLRMGRLPARFIAAQLGSWTTAEHRRAASHDVIFHAGDIPPTMDAVRERAQRYIDALSSGLSPPVDHEDHPYWVGGVRAWKRLRDLQGLSAEARELAPLLRNAPAWRRAMLNAKDWLLRRFEKLRVAIYGVRPKVTSFHPAWLECRHLDSELRGMLADAAARTLVITEEPDLLRPLLRPEDRVELVGPAVVHPPDDMPGESDELQTVTHAFLHLSSKDCRRAARLVAQCRRRMPQLRACKVFLQRPPGSSQDLSFELVTGVSDILDWTLGDVSCSFVGGRLANLVHGSMARMAGRFARGGRLTLPIVAVILLIQLPLGFLCNQFLKRRYPKSDFVPYCGTAVVRYDFAESASPTR